jgi:5-formyltetrahydrofolate cyclo-ligase
MPLLDALHARGIACGLPVIGEGLELVFRAYTPGEPLIPKPFKLHEPHPDAPIVQPEIIFVPLLAFDRRGVRLGYGGGYYDATLRNLRHAGRTITAIGAGFDEQEMHALPLEPHDERLDWVLTPSRLLKCGD